MHLDKTGLIGVKVVFLAKPLPKMIRKDQFRGEQLIQRTKIRIQHRNPELFFSSDNLRLHFFVHWLYPSSFFVTSSLSSAGLAWPFEAFITWPTKNPAMVFLPARYCSTCLGLAAMTSSISASIAEASVICSRLLALVDRGEILALFKAHVEELLELLGADLALVEQIGGLHDAGHRDRRLLLLQSQRLQPSAHLAEQQIGHAARVARGPGGGLKAVGELALGGQREGVLAR